MNSTLKIVLVIVVLVALAAYFGLIGKKPLKNPRSTDTCPESWERFFDLNTQLKEDLSKLRAAIGDAAAVQNFAAAYGQYVASFNYLKRQHAQQKDCSNFEAAQVIAMMDQIEDNLAAYKIVLDATIGSLAEDDFVIV